MNNTGISVTGIDPTFDHVVTLMAPSRIKYVSGQPYADFDEMKADYNATGILKISTDFSESTIFGDAPTNWRFRAWHDLCHIKADADFSPSGEKRAAFEMMRQVSNLSDASFEDKQRWINLIDEEVNGQLHYYMTHNQTYPIDQRQFAVDYLTTRFGPDYVASFPKSVDAVSVAY